MVFILSKNIFKKINYTAILIERKRICQDKKISGFRTIILELTPPDILISIVSRLADRLIDIIRQDNHAPVAQQDRATAS